MLTVNGKAVYPASLVHCDMLGEVKLDVVRPDTVNAPPVFVSPEPSSDVNVELPKDRFVVDAVTNDE